ncbi:LiaI-LiaF-like domain-containing protein [Pontibacillus salicampi]|uniref:LiaI-LiaF-like domain-containing protein n=1 Tax=Pontibacillus salicampi TaxID=1449801 RepID=A0ABV6LJ45_9BACI
MTKQNTFSGIFLIGIGLYFLLKELNIPIITNFYSWPTILIIIGIAMMLHSYLSRDHDKLFPGTVVLGLGIHFHGVQHFRFWIDHWGVFLFIIGIAFLIRYQKTRSGLFSGIILVGLSLFTIFVSNKPSWFHWINALVNMIETFWPLLLVLTGLYLLFFKKRT